MSLHCRDDASEGWRPGVPEAGEQDPDRRASEEDPLEATLVAVLRTCAALAAYVAALVALLWLMDRFL